MKFKKQYICGVFTDVLIMTLPNLKTILKLLSRNYLVEIKKYIHVYMCMHVYIHGYMDKWVPGNTNTKYPCLVYIYSSRNRT